jgi:putative transposase
MRDMLLGCHFTSTDFVTRLRAEEIRISWSRRKRCYDNILVERLWRTLKDEEVYLRAYSDDWEAEISLARFLWRYCHVRPHSSLGGKTPYAAYTETEPSSSRPELTISGTKAVQIKGTHLRSYPILVGSKDLELLRNQICRPEPLRSTGSRKIKDIYRAHKCFQSTSGYRFYLLIQFLNESDQH